MGGHLLLDGDDTHWLHGNCAAIAFCNTLSDLVLRVMHCCSLCHLNVSKNKIANLPNWVCSRLTKV